MNWTIKLITAILLTSVTGSIEFILWYIFSRLLERLGCTRLVYGSLKVILLFWVMPFSYIYLCLKNIDLGNGSGFVFVQTERIMLFCKLLIFLWEFVVFISIYKYVVSNRKIVKNIDNVDECDNEQRQILDSLCTELNIKRRKIKLLKSQNIKIPICVGTMTPRIIIPATEYKDSEIRHILLHELNHYKHKDIWIKHIVFVITSLNCFNPIAYIMRKKVDFWSECNCDYYVVNYTGEAKPYFALILSLLDDSIRKESLVSNLVSRKSDLELRIIQMKRSQKMSNKKKALAVVSTLCMTIAGIVVFSATTYAAEKSYMDMYNATVVDVSEGQGEDTFVEFEDTSFDAYEELDEVTEIGRASNTYSFSWTVPPSSAKRSSGFSTSSGNVITVSSVIVPSDVQVRIGIVQPNGVRRYVTGTQGFTHSFSVTQNGTHYIYVQNMSSSKSVTVSGNYVR